MAFKVVFLAHAPDADNKLQASEPGSFKVVIIQEY